MDQSVVLIFRWDTEFNLKYLHIFAGSVIPKGSSAIDLIPVVSVITLMFFRKEPFEITLVLASVFAGFPRKAQTYPKGCDASHGLKRIRRYNSILYGPYTSDRLVYS